MRPLTHLTRSGNTPACAGKSQPTRQETSPHRKYPRVRGEEGQILGEDIDIQEIPPRARGRAVLKASCQARGRNTPACAGKRTRRAAPPTGTWKYPRVRGEETPRHHQSHENKEIPPRARGRAPECARGPHALGNTPACAGKSLSDLQILTGVIQFLSGPAG